jgi:hypothetical protein
MTGNPLRVSPSTPAARSQDTAASPFEDDSLFAIANARAEIADKQRVQIRANGRNPRVIKEEALQALVEANDPPELYVFAKGLARVRSDGYSSPEIEKVDADILRNRLIEIVDFHTMKFVNGIACPEPASPPQKLMSDVLSEKSWPFPILEGIIECPYLRPDGTVLDAPGYDSTSRLLYVPAPGLDLPAIPHKPTVAERNAALGTLKEMLIDFPFDCEASEANALAAILTPLYRPAINGLIPFGLITAPQAGTGKTHLAEVITLVATGRHAAMLPAPGDTEEWRKSISSTLLRGAPVNVIDNISGELNSPELARLFTANVWSDRRLGVSKQLDIPVRSIWLGTGNNVQLGGDLPRRCYEIRLDGKSSQPWRRTGYRHDDLLGWVRAVRGQLIAAGLTLARAWYAAGCPRATTPALGNFSAWASTLGSILAFAGVPGFLDNLESMHQNAGVEDRQWELFLLALHATTGDRAVRSADIFALMGPESELNHLIPDALREAMDKCRSTDGAKAALGKQLRARKDQRHGATGVRVESAGKHGHDKVGMWRVVCG